MISSALIETAQFFDKDPTLTGRTYLWQRAYDLINETPWLGRGFRSFWLQGNPDAEGLWQYAGIASRDGFNFHNTAIEILVHIGWFGLIVYGAVVIIALGFLVARFLARPNLFLCFWLSVLVYELVRMPIESIGFNEFYFSTVLLFMALGSAFAAPAAKFNPARTQFRAQPAPGPRRSARRCGCMTMAQSATADSLGPSAGLRQSSRRNCQVAEFPISRSPTTDRCASAGGGERGIARGAPPVPPASAGRRRRSARDSGTLGFHRACRCRRPAASRILAHFPRPPDEPQPHAVASGRGRALGARIFPAGRSPAGLDPAAVSGIFRAPLQFPPRSRRGRVRRRFLRQGRPLCAWA